jgi:hypothetical protein
MSSCANSCGVKVWPEVACSHGIIQLSRHWRYLINWGANERISGMVLRTKSRSSSVPNAVSKAIYVKSAGGFRSSVRQVGYAVGDGGNDSVAQRQVHMLGAVPRAQSSLAELYKS